MLRCCGRKKECDIINPLLKPEKSWQKAFVGVREVPLFMWTVIYIAQSDKVAEKIQRRLTEEGFLVKVRAVPLSKQQYEILVPAGEVEEVQETLTEILHS
jgi:hypothetical protein